MYAQLGERWVIVYYSIVIILYVALAHPFVIRPC